MMKFFKIEAITLLVCFPSFVQGVETCLNHSITILKDIEGGRSITSKTTKLEVKWNHPPFGWLKLNTNGFVKDGSVAAWGGLLRDEMVLFCTGLAKNRSL